MGSIVSAGRNCNVDHKKDIRPVSAASTKKVEIYPERKKELEFAMKQINRPKYRIMVMC